MAALTPEPACAIAITPGTCAMNEKNMRWAFLFGNFVIGTGVIAAGVGRGAPLAGIGQLARSSSRRGLER
jgi:hypothetical protein